MTKTWSRQEIASITPPQANDVRGEAFLNALARFMGERLRPGPQVRDPQTCPAEALPALIAEASMEEFIDPDLPEQIQRDILSNRWQLQSLKGTDAGVKLALRLLGADAQIIQWHQTEPKGEPNTHRIELLVEKPIWPGEGYFGERQVRALQKMINRTKRFSQETELRTGVVAKGTAFVGAFASHTIRAVASVIPEPPPVVQVQTTPTVTPTTRLIATAGA